MSLRKLIYMPSGRAGEYSDKGYAANIFNGCDHGCLYCYAPGAKRTPGPTGKIKFHASVTPVLDLFARLSKDCAQKIDEPIFLCFLCDLYCAANGLSGITREAIRIIIDSGNAVNILTKGGMRAVQDLDLLIKNPKNKLGATLTFANPDLSKHWEPKAALPDSRLQMLSAAKDHGIQTWASIEPVIVPSESLEIMRQAAPYVDQFKIGKWNHDPRASLIDWNGFYRDALHLMESLGKDYIFKVDLLKSAGEWKSA